MEITNMDGLTVQGLLARTRNADEAHASRARIGKLWSDFGSQLAPRMALGALSYGVYHHYESDANGLFDVLVGTDAPMPNAPDAPVLSKVDIVAGAYLVFEAKGPMPQAVVQAWEGIWRYFADPHCPHSRAYTTDFERYGAQGQVEVFVGVLAA